MKVKIIANKSTLPQQMSIEKYIGRTIEIYTKTTVEYFGIGDDKDGTFKLIDGEYEIINSD